MAQRHHIERHPPVVKGLPAARVGNLLPWPSAPLRIKRILALMIPIGRGHQQLDPLPFAARQEGPRPGGNDGMQRGNITAVDHGRSPWEGRLLPQ
ncbi:hypothetical protein ABI_22040 [Asticcacaulis biprosthecium C19]|uniref:Uncharacterized protein n=1 Tax=Asticcacaulis biprosthecium C19 TaxID=715226 RepID=F4QH09_9CAUL|nr:hypothetical protein ABI_22040 [Asticcacaulis biprosthecium C19]